jgi:hypothetical protein
VRAANIGDLVISEPGVFEASLTTMRIGRVWLQSGGESLARTLHIAIGDLPRSITFLAEREATPIIQSGAEFGAGDVVSFGRNTSHFQRTFGPIRWAAMSLLPGDLEAAVNTMTGSGLGDPSASQCVKPSPARLARLRQLFQEVNRMAVSGEAILDHPEVRRSLGPRKPTVRDGIVTSKSCCASGSGLKPTITARFICRKSALPWKSPHRRCDAVARNISA